MSDRKGWMRIGNKLVNPDNVLAVKIAMAGAAARDIGYSRNKPADERLLVTAAEERRQRRLASRLENSKPTCYTCAREIPQGSVLCDQCLHNKCLREGKIDENYSGTDSGGLPRS